MNLEVRVEEAGTVIASYAVTEGKQQIGSDPSCALRVTHPEVSSVAAVLEVSAGAVFIRNQNDFPIFVGSHQLASGSVAEWRPGSVVQLTRSIALALEHLDSASALDAGLGTEKKNSINSLVQIAVIIFSVGFSAIMLSSDGESTNEEDSSVIRFDDLIQQYEQSGGQKLANLNHEQKVLLRYLTEARAMETRWGTAQQDAARTAYELVLTTRLSQRGTQDNSLEKLTKEYAASRIDKLK